MSDEKTNGVNENVPEEKADKKQKPVQKKPGRMTRSAGRVSRYLREMRSELKKVVWPSKKQLINNSLVVIVSVIFVGAVVALFDFVCQYLLNSLITVLQA
ncbi:MAG: preprotein translocase subunit SecE [Oscillospiraceae bacterium]|nr:preprotein translocase subunit SecE [Oscillospiraceae bacterium]